MKTIRVLLSIIILIIYLAWAVGFFYFYKTVDDYTLETQTITDAIVVFGNNRQSLYAGAQLLKQGYAPVVFITGKKPDVRYYNYFLKSQNLSADKFIFDNSFEGENNYAVETAIFLKK